jgi:hypothetical protein
MKKLIIATVFILLTGTVFSQTLKKGTVLAIHNITVTLAPGVTMDQYMEFLSDKFLPEAEKNFDGWKGFLVKSDRGENINSIAVVYYIESLEARDKYFKSDGTMNDVGNAAVEKMSPIMEELKKLGTYTREYDDWVIQ